MNGWSDALLFLIVSLLAVAGLIAAIIGMTLLRRWLRLQLLGTPVTLFQILAMWLRGHPPALLLDAYVLLRRAGVEATISDVENVYLENRGRIVSCDDLVTLVKQQHPVSSASAQDTATLP